MAYITQQELETKIDCPINLPLTELRVGNWIILSSFTLPAINPVEVSLRWLQMRILFPTLTSTPPGQGCSVTLGLYKDFNPQVTPANPIESITATSATPLAQRDQFTPLILNVANSGAGTYSWVATCTAGALLSINVTNGGSGYTTVPVVSLSGGSETAAATTLATMDATTGTTVTGVNIVNGGTGFVNNPTVSFSYGDATALATTGCKIIVNGGFRLNITPT